MLPEILISVGASLLLIAPVTGFRSGSSAAKWSTLVILGVTGASISICSYLVRDLPQSASFGSMFTLDAFSIFFKLLFVGTIAMVVFLSDEFLRGSRYSHWEYYSLLAFALCGMMFM